MSATTMTTAIPVIRPARPGEGTAVATILAPVYPGRPQILHPLATAIDAGATAVDAAIAMNCLVLVAEHPDGTPAAALTALPWTARTPIDPCPAVAAQARRAVAVIEGLAVAPAARGRHLGHRLLDRAAEHLTEAGYRLLMADFDSEQDHLDGFYRAAGYRIHTHGEPLKFRLNGWSLNRTPRTDTAGHLLTIAWRPLAGPNEENQ